MTKVGFTGTRKGMTEDQKATFEEVVFAFNTVEFHHGACKGADEDAHAIVMPSIHVDVVMHPGTDVWGHSPHSFYSYGCRVRPAKPYLERNHDIVDATTMLIACPGEDYQVIRSGTWATIRYAIKQGKPVTIIFPDGRVEAR